MSMDEEQRSVHNQVIGYLNGRATAVEEEASNAPDEALPSMATRAATYRRAADYLEGEER